MKTVANSMPTGDSMTIDALSINSPTISIQNAPVSQNRHTLKHSDIWSFVYPIETDREKRLLSKMFQQSPDEMVIEEDGFRFYADMTYQYNKKQVVL